MRFDERVAIVTGGASGIGRATVTKFAEEGAGVAVFDIDASEGRRVVEELQAQGAKATFHEVDVSDANACNEAASSVASEHGRIDFLVNDAVSFIAKGLDVRTEDWERCLGVNVRGYANMIQATWEAIARNGGGAVVNLCSISAHIAQPNRWTYNATKGAVLSMTRCQALDLSVHGIRVNAVSPGWTWTSEVAKAANGDRERWEPVWGRFHMLRRLGEPREVAQAILFLCSDDASFITAAELPVDGGYLGMGAEGLGEASSFAGSE